MKLGICITTYNRPQYLKRTLESLNKADLHNAQIIIVDDFSTNYQTLQLIAKYKVIRNGQNLSIRYSLQVGFDYLVAQGCNVVMNLDADAIVKPDFLTKLLNLYYQFPNNIISGFNTLSRTRSGITRHAVVEQELMCVKKHTIGGLNMLMNVNVYIDIVRPALIETQRTRDHWDKIACRNSQEKNRLIIVTSPSVVQHIGIDSAMGHRDNPDIAEDYIPDYCPKVCIVQPHGIGDVIFCMTLAKSFKADITWPVLPRFLSDLKNAYHDINFIADNRSPVSLGLKDDFETDGYRVIPIRYSDQIMKLPYNQVMRAKYAMYNLNFMFWKREAIWQRNEVKENQLYDLLGLTKNGYVLKNLTYMSNNSGKIEIDIEGIEVREIRGFSLFDWAKVFENAREIHTVSTSILYILDLLETCDVNIYIRRPMEASHVNYQYIFTDKKFIYK